MTIFSFLFFLVYSDGRVCISILHAPGDDPMGYETSAERWSPVQSVEKILLSVVSMLAGTRLVTQTIILKVILWMQSPEFKNKLQSRTIILKLFKKGIMLLLIAFSMMKNNNMGQVYPLICFQY